MCGIAGCLSLADRPSGDALRSMAEAMTTAVAHRGPDHGATWSDSAAGIGLGHRRLAIIDLSPAGHQPMVSRSGRTVITYNGEIYNFRELRQRLTDAGHSVPGQSDTSVLLEACELWGVEAAARAASGMFAFAHWDTYRRRLTLVRDRMGIKPLYWGRCGSWLLFGSELKALRSHSAWTGKIDRDGLAALVAYNYVPAPLSIHEGVGKVRPGHMVVIGEDGAIRESPYWKLEDAVAAGAANSLKESDSSSIARLESLVRAAVRRHMVADVPVAALLSGGVDSSLVTAIMQQESDSPVRTYAVRFPDPDYDEADHAAAVAGAIGSDHTEITVDDGAARDVIPRLPTLYDEPFADLSQIPTTLIANEVARHVKVVLTGDGGDEMFGGYPRYFLTLDQMTVVNRLPGPMRRLAAATARALSAPRWDAVLRRLPRVGPYQWTSSRMAKGADVLAETSFIDAYRRTTVHWPEPDDLVHGGTEPVGPLHRNGTVSRLSDPMRTMRWIDSATYLPDDILVKVDRATMSVGLEGRIPLLDSALVEFAWSLPASSCYRNGVGKWLLRQVLYRHVPRHLVDRPKMGFGVPMHNWLRGPLRDWAEDLLDARAMEAEGFLNPTPIQERWRQHLGGEVDWKYSLWPILMFQQWYRSLGSS